MATLREDGAAAAGILADEVMPMAESVSAVAGKNLTEPVPVADAAGISQQVPALEDGDDEVSDEALVFQPASSLGDGVPVGDSVVITNV